MTNISFVYENGEKNLELWTEYGMSEILSSCLAEEQSFLEYRRRMEYAITESERVQVRRKYRNMPDIYELAAKYAQKLVDESLEEGGFRPWNSNEILSNQETGEIRREIIEEVSRGESTQETKRRAFHPIMEIKPGKFDVEDFSENLYVRKE